MKRGKDFLKLLKTILVFIVAIPFFVFVGTLGIIYSFIKHLFFKFDYSSSRQLTPIFKALILLTDGFANAGAGELLNDVLKPKVNYGKWYHTISAVTGINYKLGNDNGLRKILDFVERDHSENSITPEQNTHYLKNNI